LFCRVYHPIKRFRDPARRVKRSDRRRCAPPIGLRDHASRGYAAHSAAYPLNAAAPLCGFAPIGTSDAINSICRAQGGAADLAARYMA